MLCNLAVIDNWFSNHCVYILKNTMPVEFNRNKVLEREREKGGGGEGRY